MGECRFWLPGLVLTLASAAAGRMTADTVGSYAAAEAVVLFDRGKDVKDHG